MRNDKGQFVKGTHWRKPQAFRDKQWLIEHYVVRQLSTGEIAAMFSVTDAAILYWLRRFGIERRTVSEARSIKHWGAVGADNPMWNKRGELNPRWLGGVTPERQAFYTSTEWRSVCSRVWRRDKATCQRCGLKLGRCDIPGHIHHIVSFAEKELRADASNLVLVCETCHHFIHSRKNTNHEYLQQK